MKPIILLLLSALAVDCHERRRLKEVFTWTSMDYVWPGSTGAASWGSSGIPRPKNTFGMNFQHEANLPMGATRWKNKLFITIPRRDVGVPSTLNYILLNSTERHNLPLIPYPNWSFNQLEPTRDPNGLVSVYRTVVDVCDRLWIVDTGYIETPGNHTRYHRGKVVVIDLHTDQVIRQYSFKESDVLPHSLPASLAVDVTANDCNRAFVYIPDLGGYGLIVYDFQENDSWRVTHNYLALESLHGEFLVGGQRFQWNDGVFSLALSDINPDGFRTAYFHSLAGIHLFSVSTRVLRNRQLSTRSFHEDDFKVVANRGEKAQTTGSDIHKPTGVLFLALVNQNAIGCYNINKEPRRENFDIVHKDDVNMVYPADIKIHHDDVIVLNNIMPVQLYSRLNYNQINFRVWMGKVADVVKDTQCAPRYQRPMFGYH